MQEVCERHRFGNPFDATKVDRSELLPEIMREDDTFVLHVGEGRHALARGIGAGFHDFEPVPDGSVIDWPYRKSALNEADTSESNIISVASNQRILHDFLYGDIVASPKTYNARRTKCSFTFRVGEQEFEAHNLQMEIDFTLEYGGRVTTVEGKNGFPRDFAVYQLYNPFRYFVELAAGGLPIERVACCYILRDGNVLRMFEYTFNDAENMDSLTLLNCAEYHLKH